MRRAKLVPADRVIALDIVDDPRLRDTPRHYAETAVETLQVRIHPDAIALGPKRYLAILLHELGHVIELAKTPLGTLLVDDPQAPEDEEERADWIAYQVFDIPIRYDVKDKVQTLDRNGIPRPRGLR